MDASGPRVVMVHDWLTGMRGGEKCLEILRRRWPDAPLYTLLHRPGAVSKPLATGPVVTSWLGRLPGVHRYYRYLLPLMPAAADRWRLPPCDLVVSLSHCVAKGAQPPRGVPHVCYCFTPMRYAWHMRSAYFGNREHGLRARLVGRQLRRLRRWDRQSAERVTHFVAISQTVRARITECYARESVVIYPPVDTDFYTPAPVPREDYYLAVSALVPYKRLDLAVQACNRLGRRLVVIGAGPYERRLRDLAGPTVHFLGWQPDDAIRQHFRRCRALLFPGEEDFGIVPVEAQACGTPVIAYGRGGATETVVPPGPAREPTGWWFEEQTADGLADAIVRSEKAPDAIAPAAARQNALRFSADRFRREMFALLDAVLQTGDQPARRAA